MRQLESNSWLIAMKVPTIGEFSQGLAAAVAAIISSRVSILLVVWTVVSPAFIGFWGIPRRVSVVTVWSVCSALYSCHCLKWTTRDRLSMGRRVVDSSIVGGVLLTLLSLSTVRIYLAPWQLWFASDFPDVPTCLLSTYNSDKLSCHFITPGLSTLIEGLR